MDDSFTSFATVLAALILGIYVCLNPLTALCATLVLALFASCLLLCFTHIELWNHYLLLAFQWALARARDGILKLFNRAVSSFLEVFETKTDVKDDAPTTTPKRARPKLHFRVPAPLPDARPVRRSKGASNKLLGITKTHGSRFPRRNDRNSAASVTTSQLSTHQEMPSLSLCDSIIQHHDTLPTATSSIINIPFSTSLASAGLSSHRLISRRGYVPKPQNTSSKLATTSPPMSLEQVRQRTAFLRQHEKPLWRGSGTSSIPSIPTITTPCVELPAISVSPEIDKETIDEAPRALVDTCSVPTTISTASTLVEIPTLPTIPEITSTVIVEAPSFVINTLSGPTTATIPTISGKSPSTVEIVESLIPLDDDIEQKPVETTSSSVTAVATNTSIESRSIAETVEILISSNINIEPELEDTLSGPVTASDNVISCESPASFKSIEILTLSNINTEQKLEDTFSSHFTTTTIFKKADSPSATPMLESYAGVHHDFEQEVVDTSSPSSSPTTTTTFFDIPPQTEVPELSFKESPAPTEGLRGEEQDASSSLDEPVFDDYRCAQTSSDGESATEASEAELSGVDDGDEMLQKQTSDLASKMNALAESLQQWRISRFLNDRKSPETTPVEGSIQESADPGTVCQSRADDTQMVEAEENHVSTSSTPNNTASMAMHVEMGSGSIIQHDTSLVNIGATTSLSSVDHEMEDVSLGAEAVADHDVSPQNHDTTFTSPSFATSLITNNLSEQHGSQGLQDSSMTDVPSQFNKGSSSTYNIDFPAAYGMEGVGESSLGAEVVPGQNVSPPNDDTSFSTSAPIAVHVHISVPVQHDSLRSQDVDMTEVPSSHNDVTSAPPAATPLPTIIPPGLPLLLGADLSPASVATTNSLDDSSTPPPVFRRVHPGEGYTAYFEAYFGWEVENPGGTYPYPPPSPPLSPPSPSQPSLRGGQTPSGGGSSSSTATNNAAPDTSSALSQTQRRILKPKLSKVQSPRETSTTAAPVASSSPVDTGSTTTAIPNPPSVVVPSTDMQAFGNVIAVLEASAPIPAVDTSSTSTNTSIPSSSTPLPMSQPSSGGASSSSITATQMVHGLLPLSSYYPPPQPRRIAPLRRRLPQSQQSVPVVNDTGSSTTTAPPQAAPNLLQVGASSHAGSLASSSTNVDTSSTASNAVISPASPPPSVVTSASGGILNQGSSPQDDVDTASSSSPATSSSTATPPSSNEDTEMAIEAAQTGARANDGGDRTVPRPDPPGRKILPKGKPRSKFQQSSTITSPPAVNDTASNTTALPPSSAPEPPITGKRTRNGDTVAAPNNVDTSSAMLDAAPLPGLDRPPPVDTPRVVDYNDENFSDTPLGHFMASDAQAGSSSQGAARSGPYPRSDLVPEGASWDQKLGGWYLPGGMTAEEAEADAAFGAELGEEEEMPPPPEVSMYDDAPEAPDGPYYVTLPPATSQADSSAMVTGDMSGQHDLQNYGAVGSGGEDEFMDFGALTDEEIAESMQAEAWLEMDAQFQASQLQAEAWLEMDAHFQASQLQASAVDAT